MIDDRVSERAIEPSRARSFVADRIRALHPTNERLLQDVLGVGAVAHAFLDETQELAMVFDESLHHVFRERLLDFIGHGERL